MFPFLIIEYRRNMLINNELQKINFSDFIIILLLFPGVSIFISLLFSGRVLNQNTSQFLILSNGKP